MAEVASIVYIPLRKKAVNIVFMLDGAFMKTNALFGLTSFQPENEKKILDQLFV